MELSSNRFSSEHGLQLLHPLLNLCLQLRKIGQQFARRAMRYLCVDDFFVPIEREVVALRHQVSFGDAKALRSAGTLTLRGVSLPPASSDVGKVVLYMLIGI